MARKKHRWLEARRCGAHVRPLTCPVPSEPLLWCKSLRSRVPSLDPDLSWAGLVHPGLLPPMLCHPETEPSGEAGSQRDEGRTEGSWPLLRTPLESQSCSFASLLSEGLRGRVGWGEKAAGGEVLPATLHPHPCWGFQTAQTPILQSNQSLHPPPVSPFGLSWGTVRPRRQEAMVEEGRPGWGKG